MDDRLRFIAAFLRKEEPMRGLCARFGIGRTTGHKWLEPKAAGAAGVTDRKPGASWQDVDD